MATDRSIDTFVNGQGGDAVFCHLQSSGPAADTLRAKGPSPNFARTVFEVARANQCNAWDLGWKAIRKGWKGKHHANWRANDAFLSKDLPSNERSEEHKSELQSLMRISY